MNFIDIMPKEVKHKLQEKSYAAGNTILYAEEENNFVYFYYLVLLKLTFKVPMGIFQHFTYINQEVFGEIEQFYDGKSL